MSKRSDMAREFRKAQGNVVQGPWEDAKSAKDLIEHQAFLDSLCDDAPEESTSDVLERLDIDEPELLHYLNHTTGEVFTRDRYVDTGDGITRYVGRKRDPATGLYCHCEGCRNEWNWHSNTGDTSKSYPAPPKRMPGEIDPGECDPWAEEIPPF